MHQHIINASLQIIPIVQDKHPYEWVDEAIAVIKQQGIQYEVGPFATVIEGTYEAVMETIHAINNYLQAQGCHEWILTHIEANHRRIAACGWFHFFCWG